MPASTAPADDAAASGSAMPTSVRVATIAMSLLAALLLINAVLTWFGRAVVAKRIIEAGNGGTLVAAERSVVLSMIPFLVLGLLLALSAFFLPRRQPWARWTGLAASGLLALLSVVSVGAITLASLLLLALAIAAVVSLVSRTTSSWVPRLRAAR